MRIYCPLVIFSTRQKICTIMGRKRNQGKARKEAKAKAMEEAKDRRRNNICEEAQWWCSQLPCKHGAGPISSTDICFQFATIFGESFDEAIRGGRYDGKAPLWASVSQAQKATLDQFAEVWHDPAKMEMAMSYLLCIGTQQYLEGEYDYARQVAAIARWLEQDTAVCLKRTQALFNVPKVDETFHSDEHTLVKFLRHRIPCSCLDAKYEEVKSITKMGLCYNPNCNFEGGEVERSKTKYCSRCRCCVTYCSRECQEDDWTNHKEKCVRGAAMISKFESEQQNL